MKLDPGKPDLARLASLLRKLAASHAKMDGRNWAEDTVKTLQAGKLEDFDLEEFVSQAYDSELAGREGESALWERSRGLLALIEEMQARKIRAPKASAVAQALSRWTKPE